MNCCRFSFKFCYRLFILLLFGGVNSAFANERLASSAVSFNPTPGDLSVTFLGNIFGVVDGVLAGTGSQIVGAMFGVFNSAVLFLGGVILLYMLMVSTLNTSNDGKLVGQKWSSLWIPVRSTMGVALLLPKASGYCAIQIFIMFVVVQGIGAADTLWNRTLDYLNRGGVIMQTQMDANTSADSGSGEIMNTAMGLVAAQVCMQALEKSYIDLRKSELKDSSQTSNCNSSVEGSANTNMWYQFCNNEVPDFLNSVTDSSLKNLSVPIDPSSPVSNSTPQPGDTVYQQLPYFGDPSAANASIYTELNGVCGQLSWDVYEPVNSDSTLNNADNQMIINSRTIAVYQMYASLIPLTTTIFNNTPIFNNSIDCARQGCVNNSYAQNFYGYPLNQSSEIGCLGRKTTNQQYNDENSCTRWGTVAEKPAILNGTELQDAVATYNGVMMPTLTSSTLNNSQNQAAYASRRSFINGAKKKGWILAGSYFFRLAILNNYVLNQTKSADITDSSSNLSISGEVVSASTASSWTYQSIKDVLTPSTATPTSAAQCLGQIATQVPFCQLASGSTLEQIGNLISGPSDYGTSVPNSTMTVNKGTPSNFNTRYLNVYTYLINANSLFLPNEAVSLDAGLNANVQSFNPSQSAPKMGSIRFRGGKWGISGAVSDILWNKLYRPVYNAILGAVVPPLMILFAFILAPIIGLSANAFNSALNIMRTEGVNPIMALAQMGVEFIDSVGDTWVMIVIEVISNPITIVTLFLLILLAPIIFAWMGIMVTVGFTAAFYVPFVPFLVFTFAAIGWLIAVIEGMVAAPIVALGVLNPEGQDDVFGKGDHALMLLLNMFLRPSLMIIGYMLGIGMSYVGVWILNAGFNITFKDMSYLTPVSSTNIAPHIATKKSYSMYGFWTNIFLFYFGILTYVTLYLSIVQQSFELIHQLPDKILRWLAGGVREQLGEASTRTMIDKVKSASDDAAKQSSGAMAKASSGMQNVASGGIMDDPHSNLGAGSSSSKAKQ